MNLKKIFSQKKFGVYVYLIFITILFACNLGDNEPIIKPEIPPNYTIDIDFSDFRHEIPESKFDEYSNWLQSTGFVEKWDTLVSVSTYIPFSIFKQADNYEPSYEAGSWLWNYTSIIDDVKYLVNLYGTVENDSVIWDLYVTKEGFYEDFLWLSGKNDISKTKGTWILKKSYSENYNFLEINWLYSRTNNSIFTKYTNIIADNEYFSSYISYGNNLFGNYDSSFDIYDVKINKLMKIWWNSKNMSGMLIDPLEDIFLCWNENFLNEECEL